MLRRCCARASPCTSHCCAPAPARVPWSPSKGSADWVTSASSTAASTLGYQVAAIARGSDKAALAVQLGADHYIDSVATDPAAALRELGGAAAIIATAASGASMSPLVAGLAPNGRMVIVGVGQDPYRDADRGPGTDHPLGRGLAHRQLY